MWKLVFIFFFILVMIAYLVPKRLSRIELYTTSLFALLFGINVDLIFVFKYHLYGYFGEGFQWLGFVGEFLYFIPVSILFLNYYPFKGTNQQKLLYILAWTAGSSITEFIVERTHFFNYTGWKLWYSIFLYPIVFLILVAHLRMVRRIIKLDR
ncbi:CBO0543 family protein [Neobacillus sp. 179-C4.2 HS]|uniref:CBO0543 family protein n=1 Tax=Neobacillus driksii TaxID=3035913 RepID=A0ABV4Z041_9BACI|nr:CBO0543 family protein [Neobacillus sp. 179.-C4.2 HS]MDP5196780.1 hypothetical protein [Neobacillus sp. 179.-C4.2 HS]